MLNIPKVIGARGNNLSGDNFFKAPTLGGGVNWRALKELFLGEIKKKNGTKKGTHNEKTRGERRSSGSLCSQHVF